MFKSDFHGPLLKIERAKFLLLEMSGIEANFWQQCQPTVEPEIDAATGQRFAVARIPDYPPEIIHVLSAEIIYHLRSSLDQIAVKLAVMSGVTKSKLRNIYFPSGQNVSELRLAACGETDDDFAKRKKTKPGSKRNVGKIEGLDNDLIELILGQNPYPEGDYELYSIFPLAIIDKHVELIPTANRGQFTGAEHFSYKNCIVAIILDGGGNLNEGMRISELGPDGSITKLHPDAKMRISGQIAFGNTPVYEGHPIATVLDKLIIRVSRLIQTVTDHCIKTGRMENPMDRVSKFSTCTTFTV